MSRKISILVYGRMPTEKAYGIHALNQSKSFEKLGYEVELIYPSTNNSKTIDKTVPKYYNENLNFKIIEKDNFDLTGLGIFKFLPDFLKKLLWLLSSYIWAKKLRNELNDSIIWSTNPIICWTLKSSYKIIFEKHGEGKLLQKVFINKLKDKQFYLIGTTMTSYNELKKINNNSIYLPNGVDLDRFYPNNLENAKIVVGYSGMLETYGFDKGMLNAIREILKLMDTLNFNVVVIGGPEYKINEIKEEVEKSIHSNNFQFFDRLSQSALAEQVRRFDIGLVPYPNNKHTNLYASPLKIFEYIASGVIPLVSDLTAHKEIELNEIVFYRNGDFGHFNDVLKSLLNKEVVKNKKVKILNQIPKLSLDHRTEKILELLRL